jgi:hypothetical protein
VSPLTDEGAVSRSAKRIEVTSPGECRDLCPFQSGESKGKTMVNWHNYIACFFAGMFLANFVPHFVHGISGDHFPTPFAHPPGKGLSSSTVNVVWALFNLVVGYVLFRLGKITSGDDLAVVIFFGGIVVISSILSVRFASKQAA